MLDFSRLFCPRKAVYCIPTSQYNCKTVVSDPKTLVKIQAKHKSGQKAGQHFGQIRGGTLLTGGGDYGVTLNANGSAGTFNNLGGTYDGTSGTKNVLELKFVSATEAYYQFSKVTT